MFCGLRLPSLRRIFSKKRPNTEPAKPETLPSLGVFDLHLRCGCTLLWDVNERGKYPVAVDNMTSRKSSLPSNTHCTTR